MPFRTGNGGPLTDHSGTITAGGTAQTAVNERGYRTFLFIQNPTSASESFWVNFDGTAAVADSPSIEVAAGVTLIFGEGGFLPNGAVSVIAATTGTKFTIKEA